MKASIEAIVQAFAPEMERISRLEESKENKVRITENWLRARLEQLAVKFATIACGEDNEWREV